MYNAILRKIVVFIVCIVCMSQMMLPKLKGMNDEDQFESIRDNYTTFISRRYSFDQPLISEIQLDQTYQSISLQGHSKNGKTGSPVLPIQCVNILLPYGCTDTDYIITIEVGKRADIDIGNLLIEPGQRYYVDHQSATNIESTKPDEKIYSSNDSFPGEIYEDTGIYYWRGFSLLTLQLNPVQYIPSYGELYYYESIDLTIETKSSNYENSNYRGLPCDMDRIIDMVGNPETLSTYPENSIDAIKKLDYVIITTEDFVEPFEKLEIWKESRNSFTPNKNLNIDIVLLEEIISNSSFWWDGYWGDGQNKQIFNDTQCKIRNFCKMAYSKWKTDYVLLGGDADEPIIPHRGMYVYDYDCGGHYTDYDIPCDMYYGCLDGNWNTNENDQWGEKPESDLLAELYIGRAPVDSLEEAFNFVNKTIAYEQATARDELYLQTSLMIGSRSDEKTERGNSKDAATEIIPQYSVSRTYLRDNTYHREDILEYLERGPHIVDYSGHSSNTMYTSPDSIQNYHIAQLTNKNYSLVCSGGCYSASFDNRKSNGDYTCDAVGEAFVVSEGGAFAYVGNSRYGWYEPRTIIGPNDRYGRALFQSLMSLSLGEQGTNLGKALQLAKEYLLLEQRYIHLWTYYTLNLLGDPEVQIEMVESAPIARFMMPIDNGEYKLFPISYGDGVEIMGTACRGRDPGSSFDHYTIEYGEGMNPTTWSSEAITMRNNGMNEIVQGTLAKVDPQKLSNGPHIFRLSVYDAEGRVSHDWNVVMIANASTVYNKNNGKKYHSIQTAIDSAKNNDIIHVNDREYFEYVCVDKPLSLIGNGKNKTIIDGCFVRSVIELYANGTTISGMTTRNSGMLQSFTYAFAGISVLSNKNVIRDNYVTKNDLCGIFIYEALGNYIVNNIVEDNDFFGIKLTDSEKNNVIGNQIMYQMYGIRLDGSDNNSIDKNRPVENTVGVQLLQSNNNSITKNHVYENNNGGIRLSSFSCYNTVTNNSVHHNDGGMKCEYFSSNNTIFHNIFMNNEGGNAYDECNNTWDSGYPGGGNYWDDYNGSDVDGDGIGDDPYDIPGGENQDRYPLMNPNMWSLSNRMNPGI